MLDLSFEVHTWTLSNSFSVSQTDMVLDIFEGDAGPYIGREGGVGGRTKKNSLVTRELNPTCTYTIIKNNKQFFEHIQSLSIPMSNKLLIRHKEVHFMVQTALSFHKAGYGPWIMMTHRDLVVGYVESM